jgi:uncharacterized membrane protein YeaQ/YmgE (transglycosylase-associated protein family)
MNLLLWIIFGALVGWIASLVMDTDEEQGTVLNVVVGVVGAFLGGTLMNFFGVPADVTGFNLTSFVVALIGAIVLIAIVRALRGAGRSTSLPKEHYR